MAEGRLPAKNPWMIVVSQLARDSARFRSRIMMDQANAYAIPYADTVVNVPMSDSGYLLEDRSVPFYQIAVRGIADYAGSPLEHEDRSGVRVPQKHRVWRRHPLPLDLCTKPEHQEHRQSKLFSLNYLSEYEHAVENYKKAAAVLGPLQGLAIVSHEPVTDVEGVTVTEYENGTKIYVNYNDYNMLKSTDLPVDALSFAGKEGGLK
jgi:hypothetical protein